MDVDREDGSFRTPIKVTNIVCQILILNVFFVVLSLVIVYYYIVVSDFICSFVLLLFRIRRCFSS